MIACAKAGGARVVAIGTTVVRALEHAASEGVVHAGEGVADQRIDRDTALAVVDMLLTGAHEAGTSHHALLRAFATDETLRRIDATLDAHGYRTHEFGDSLLLERERLARRRDVRYACRIESPSMRP